MALAASPALAPGIAGLEALESETTVVTAKVWQMSFRSHDVYEDRTENTKYLEDWRDNNLNGDATDPGDSLAPVCCTAGEPVEVQSISIVVSQPISLVGAVIVGSVNGLPVYEGTNLTGNWYGNNTIWSIDCTSITGGMTAPTTIDVWDDRTIEWKIAYSTSPTEYAAGTTSSDIYFVLLPPPASFKLRYTLLDLGCRAAQGLDFTDADGIEGQATGDPHSLFHQHIVVRFGNRLFDASYGTVYDIPAGATGDDILESIDEAIDGFAIAYWETDTLSLNELELQVDLDGDNVVEDKYVDTRCCVIMENPAGNQLKVFSQNVVPR